ncbi:hypothetical protein PG989_003188 [Apiospora arundinis]
MGPYAAFLQEVENATGCGALDEVSLVDRALAGSAGLVSWSVSCPDGGCDHVLTSSYASVERRRRHVYPFQDSVRVLVGLRSVYRICRQMWEAVARRRVGIPYLEMTAPALNKATKTAIFRDVQCLLALEGAVGLVFLGLCRHRRGCCDRVSSHHFGEHGALQVGDKHQGGAVGMRWLTDADTLRRRRNGVGDDAVRSGVDDVGVRAR